MNSRALSLAGEALEGIEGARGVDGDAALVRPPDPAPGVDDVGDPARQPPRVVPGAPPARDAAVGVAEQPEGQAQLARPGEVALGRVGRDADQLGVDGGEAGLILPEPGELEVSAAGERLDVEGDHDEVAPGQELGEPERLAVLVAEHDGGRGLVDRERAGAGGAGGERAGGEGEHEAGDRALQLADAGEAARSTA